MRNYLIISDEDLFHLIKQDDALAFSELYNRYKRPMLALAMKKLADEELQEDLVHDLFVKIWINRASIHIQQEIKSYLYKALRNRILDVFSHQVHERKYLDSLKAFEDVYSPEADFEIREKQFLVELDQLMERYSTTDKTILKMRMDGYSNSEIAEHLGIAEKTVRNKYSLIIKNLGGKLKILSLFYFF